MIDISPIFQAYFSPPLLLALIISLAVIPLLRLPAKLIGLVDHPGGRKQHRTVATLIGGPSIIIACVISILIWGFPQGYEGMAYATLGLFLIGIFDDIHDISAKLRLIIQATIIISALYVDNVWVTNITLSDTLVLPFGIFAYPLTAFAILGIMNAINMLDGVDGLSSGVVLIILGFLISTSLIANTSDITHLGLILFGSVLGFWAYNYRFSWREKATVFMGDSGTTILGFMLPYFAIKLSVLAPSIAPKSMLLWFFAIPLWDICAVVIKRMKDSKSPLTAGRDHIHHMLMNIGLSVRHTNHMIYLLCICTTSFGIVVMYFELTPIEIYVVFAFLMVIYLDRVFALTKKHTLKSEAMNNVAAEDSNISSINSKKFKKS